MFGDLHLLSCVLAVRTVLGQQFEDSSSFEVRKRGLSDPNDPRNLFNFVYADYYKRRRTPRETQNERLSFVDDTPALRYQPEPVSYYQSPELVDYYKPEP